MSVNLPVLLSTLTHYMSLVVDVVVYLYGHIALYAHVVSSWLLTNVLMYVVLLSNGCNYSYKHCFFCFRYMQYFVSLILAVSSSAVV